MILQVASPRSVTITNRKSLQGTLDQRLRRRHDPRHHRHPLPRRQLSHASERVDLRLRHELRRSRHHELALESQFAIFQFPFLKRQL